MTPPTPDIAVSEERVNELREWLTSLTSGSDDDIRADLLSILDDYASLRAEVERLKENVQRCEENYAEALHLASTYQETAEKAEAQLAKQAPLIQAVMGADIKYEEIIDGNRLKFNGDLRTEGFIDILRAALKLREEKK